MCIAVHVVMVIMFV